MGIILSVVPAFANSSFKASLVLGQTSFTSRDPSSATMSLPVGATIDPAGHVLVADERNHRVLIWDSIPVASTSVPDRVLGQTNALDNAPNRGGALDAGTLGCPHGVWSDGTRVAVADKGNDRVLIWTDLWDAGTPKFGPPAQVVLGKISFTSGMFGGCDRNNTVTASRGTLRGPTSIASDGVRFFVADMLNHRVLQWFSFPSSSGVAPDRVIGQSNFTTAAPPAPTPANLVFPYDLATDGTRLAVADTGHHRVLIWNSIPGPSDPDGKPADVVVGQRDFTSASANAGGAIGSRTLRTPTGVDLSGGALLVSDRDNSRVLLYDPIPAAAFAKATDELGHGRFTSGTAGGGDTGVTFPGHVRLRAGRIIVADTYGNRALIFPAPVKASGSLSIASTTPLTLTLSWPAVTGASGYRIFREGSWFTDVTGNLTTSFIDDQLSAGSYRYSVSVLSDENRLQGSSLGSVTGAPATPASMPPLVVSHHSSYKSYLADGDSISAVGDSYVAPPEIVSHTWTKQIGEYLGAGSKSHFAAVGGSVCESVESRMAANIASKAPDLVTVAIGLNDARDGYLDTIGARSMDSYRDCLNRLIDAIQPGPARTLVLVNLYHITNWDLMSPQIDVRFKADNKFAAATEEKAAAWNKLIAGVALHRGVPLVDAYSVLEARAEDVLLGDGIHPNQRGYDLIAQAVLKQVISLAPAEVSSMLPGHPFAESERVTSNSLRFTWSASSAPVDAYEIQWSLNPAFASASSAQTTATEKLIEGLTEGRWFFRARGISGGTPGPWSLSGRSYVDLSAPTQPGRPSAALGSKISDAVWKWGPSQDQSGFVHYEYCLSKELSVASCAFNGTTNQTTLYARGLETGTWFLKVRAIDAAGRVSVYSDPGAWVSSGL